MDRLNFTHQAKRKGFNLIEAAIVLGVVGLVIGGIWWAASAAMEAQRINRTIDFAFSVASNINSSWKNTLWSLPNAKPLSSCAVKAGLVPRDFINPSGSDDCAGASYTAGYIISHPWANTKSKGVVINAYPSRGCYYITFIGLPNNICGRLATAISVRAKNGLVISGINLTWGYVNEKPSSEFPLSVTSCSVLTLTVPL